jgi:hypothetical protein
MISFDLWSQVTNNCYLEAIATENNAFLLTVLNHAMSKIGIRYETSLDGLP